MSNDARKDKRDDTQDHDCTGAVVDAILGDLEAGRPIQEAVSRGLKNYDEGRKEIELGARALAAGRDPRMQESVEAMNSLFDDFRPTHQHAEGGLYQVLDTSLKVQMPCRLSRSNLEGLEWVPGIRYRNDKGEQFVRARDYFEHRFKPYTHYSQSIHKEAIMEALPWVPRGADRRVQQRGFTSAEKRSNGERRKDQDAHEIYFLTTLQPEQRWTIALHLMAKRAAEQFHALEEELTIKDGWLHERALKIEALEETLRTNRRSLLSTRAVFNCPDSWTDSAVLDHMGARYRTLTRDMEGALEIVPPKYRQAMEERVKELESDNTRKGHRILDLDQQLIAASGINAKLRDELRETTVQKNSNWAAYVGADAMMRTAQEREVTAHANLKHERTVVRKEERLSLLRELLHALSDRRQYAIVDNTKDATINEVTRVLNLMIQKGALT